jgi:hypothetical protein
MPGAYPRPGLEPVKMELEPPNNRLYRRHPFQKNHIFMHMDIKGLIKRLVKESVGSFKFSNGASTLLGSKMIFYATTDKEVQAFSLEHPNDKKAIFDKVWTKFFHEFEGQFMDGDREAAFYDFMANYTVPQSFDDINKKSNKGYDMDKIARHDKVYQMKGGRQIGQKGLSQKALAVAKNVNYGLNESAH